uniref:Uncharacterized protein n=1 Tax=Lygus hesperus TaxID=30085 RepID=A0A0K8S9C3_LYGHE
MRRTHYLPVELARDSEAKCPQPHRDFSHGGRETPTPKAPPAPANGEGKGGGRGIEGEYPLHPPLTAPTNNSTSALSGYFKLLDPGTNTKVTVFYDYFADLGTSCKQGLGV